MRTRTLSIAGMAVMGFITAALAIEEQAPAKDPTKLVQPREQRGRVAIRDFAVARDGTVSGALCNVSNEAVRDVRLVIERTWVSTKESRTGTDVAGRSEFHTVAETIPPGGQLPFAYRPSAALPNRTDGHYDTSVGVVGLVAIGPGTARPRKGG